MTFQGNDESRAYRASSRELRTPSERLRNEARAALESRRLANSSYDGKPRDAGRIPRPDWAWLAAPACASIGKHFGLPGERQDGLEPPVCRGLIGERVGLAFEPLGGSRQQVVRVGKLQCDDMGGERDRRDAERADVKVVHVANTRQRAKPSFDGGDVDIPGHAVQAISSPATSVRLCAASARSAREPAAKPKPASTTKTALNRTAHAKAPPMSGT